MQLTPHFKSEEFIVSKEHPELLKDIVLTETDLCKIFYLCRLFLEPLRDLFGEIRILSGKRSEALNKAIGGVPTSDHLYTGYAAAVDFTCNDVSAAADVLDSEEGFGFGQMIYYPEKNFIHLSLPTPKHKGETLIKRGNQYFPYL